jgi:hypothetical protein
MKKTIAILIGILICFLVIGGAFYWASSLMDSIYAYRSPLHNSPPRAGEALGAANTRSLVIVLIDALRYDTSINPEVMPYLNQLRSNGASAVMHSRPPSYSEPSYAVILTGAWPELSDGPAMNLEYEDIPTFTQDNIYSAADRAGLTTAISAFNWFEKLVPQQAVSASFYTAGEDQLADREVVDAALPWLRSGKYQLVLIHLDQVDYAGHYEGGPIDPRWDAAATRADGLLKEIANTMDLSQDTLLVISDHGQIDTGGHGGQDPIVLVEPFVLVGKGVMQGDYGDVQMVDVAPTVAAILGTNIPASNQGHARVGMFDFSLLQVGQINADLALQQDQLAVNYAAAINQPVNVVQSSDIVAATQNAMNAARVKLLDFQMVPRGIIAIIAAFMLLTLVAWYARPYYQWMLLGTGVYLLIFNIKYILLDHKTYSLSSVTGPDGLIFSAAFTTLIALFFAWILAILGSKVYQFKPSTVTDFTLKFIFTVLSILAIPILVHYVIDGAVVTWALPNFLISFLGLIFLIQCLMVATIGLFFTAISPLIGLFAHGK